MLFPKSFRTVASCGSACCIRADRLVRIRLDFLENGLRLAKGKISSLSYVTFATPGLSVRGGTVWPSVGSDPRWSCQGLGLSLSTLIGTKLAVIPSSGLHGVKRLKAIGRDGWVLRFRIRNFIQSELLRLGAPGLHFKTVS